MNAVWSTMIAEFGDTLTYTPYTEPVNAEPMVDNTREAGDVKVVLTVPGVQLGMGWQLANAMHARSDENPMICYRQRGLLVNVHEHDQFFLASGASTYIDGPRRFEVSDAPLPVGFGILKVKLKELTLLAGDTTA